MPCCGNTDKKPSESVAASTVATPPEQVKTADDSGVPTAVHAEEKSERTKKRDCGCQC
jgi:hypothetical protein